MEGVSRRLYSPGAVAARRRAREMAPCCDNVPVATTSLAWRTPGGYPHRVVNASYVAARATRGIRNIPERHLQGEQEMLDFCGAHGIASDVEVIPVQQINEAFERMLRGDVKFRFVIDLASLAS